MKPGLDLLVISLGGACGALLRYFVSCASVRWIQHGFPWGTFFSNLIGCFLLGLMIGGGHDQKSESVRLGFGIGFLGSLTTFSTFSAETIKHSMDGNWAMAATNVVANLVVCLLAVAIGISVGRKLFN